VTRDNPDVDEDESRHIPVEHGYVWSPITSTEDFKRATLDRKGRPWIDGHPVTITAYRQFGDEWCDFYEALNARSDPLTG
jgi:hypothetical protein